MRMFPVTCLDNFYNDPNGIRNFALSLNYEKTPGHYPGYRTDNLQDIHEHFHILSVNKLLSLFFQIDPSEVMDFKWQATNFFQKIYPYHKDVNNILNVGDIHQDQPSLKLAAVIYLNPNPSIDSGTSFYQCKEDCKEYYPDDNHSKIKSFCYRDSECEEYSEELRTHNLNYEKTIEVKNLYNRLIAYPPQLFHAQTNYCMINEDFRLTQVFFIDLIETSLSNPISRSNMYDV